MAEAHRFEEGQHYCIVCPPNGEFHRSGAYRALTTREKEVYQERIATLKGKVKRAFKVCESCHKNTSVARSYEFDPHWDSQRPVTPETRAAQDACFF